MSQRFLLSPVPQNKTGRIYCGATVLLMLTGIEYPKLRAMINRHRNVGRGSWSNPLKMNAPVRGMFDKEMEHMLVHLNLKPKYVDRPAYKTLREMAEDMQHLKTPVVVTVTGHFVLLLEGVIYDTYSPEGKIASEHKCARKKVQHYWIINSKRKQVS